MKTKPKPISIKLSSVILYLEDLEALEEIYKENFDNYKIIFNEQKLENELEFDSINELKEILIKKGIIKINNLSFQSYNTYIHTDFNTHDVRIYSSDNTAKSLGIIEKIKKTLETTSKYRMIKYLSNIWLIIFLLLTINFINPILLPESIQKFCFTSVMILYIFYSIWLYNLKIKNYSSIYLKNKDPNKNFFSKNKDNILVGIIVGVIVLVIERLLKINNINII